MPALRLLVLALLPALVYGPVLGGLAAWVHAHGPSGAHLHLLQAQTEQADLHERHDELHGHAHERHEHEAPEPEGLLIEFPQVLANAPRDPGAGPAASATPAAPVQSVRSSLLFAGSTHRAYLCRSAWPPQEPARTGVAALLLSSHALLI